MKTVNDMWEEYKRKVIPNDISIVQLSNQEQIFYAGLMSMFDSFVNAMKSDMSDADVDETMHTWHLELQFFIEALRIKIEKENE